VGGRWFALAAALILSSLHFTGCDSFGYIASYNPDPEPDAAIEVDSGPTPDGVDNDGGELPEPVDNAIAYISIKVGSEAAWRTRAADNFVSIDTRKEKSVTIKLKGEVDCSPDPKENPRAVCGFYWELGDGKKHENVAEPTSLTFDKEGYYHVKLYATTLDTATMKTDKIVSVAHLYVAVWNGTFKDDFNRSDIEWDKRGWIKPIYTDFEYVLKDGWLYQKQDHGAPASTAIFAMPQMKDAHAEVTVKRYPNPLEIHYMDVIFRALATARTSKFYRVRIDQSQDDQGLHLRIAIFKIYQDDQHGLLISDQTNRVNDISNAPVCDAPKDPPDPTFNRCAAPLKTAGIPNGWAFNCQFNRCVPIQCIGCVKMPNFNPSRDKDFRILIDFKDENVDVGGGKMEMRPTWDVTIVDPESCDKSSGMPRPPCSTVYVKQKVSDLSNGKSVGSEGGVDYAQVDPGPHMHAGFVGLAHFDLETYFDDFVIESLD
jgi:hypothetical protein